LVVYPPHSPCRQAEADGRDLLHELLGPASGAPAPLISESQLQRLLAQWELRGQQGALRAAAVARLTAKLQADTALKMADADGDVEVNRHIAEALVSEGAQGMWELASSSSAAAAANSNEFTPAAINSLVTAGLRSPQLCSSIHVPAACAAWQLAARAKTRGLLIAAGGAEVSMRLVRVVYEQLRQQPEQEHQKQEMKDDDHQAQPEPSEPPQQQQQQPPNNKELTEILTAGLGVLALLTVEPRGRRQILAVPGAASTLVSIAELAAGADLQQHVVGQPVAAPEAAAEEIAGGDEAGPEAWAAEPPQQDAAEVLCSCLLRDPPACINFLAAGEGGLPLLLRLLRTTNACVAFCAVAVIAALARWEGRQNDEESVAVAAKQVLQQQPLALLTEVGDAIAMLLQKRLDPQGSNCSSSSSGADEQAAWLEHGSLAYWVIMSAAAHQHSSSTIISAITQAGQLLSSCANCDDTASSSSAAKCSLAGAVCVLGSCTDTLQSAFVTAAAAVALQEQATIFEDSDKGASTTDSASSSLTVSEADGQPDAAVEAHPCTTPQSLIEQLTPVLEGLRAVLVLEQKRGDSDLAHAKLLAAGAVLGLASVAVQPDAATATASSVKREVASTAIPTARSSSAAFSIGSEAQAAMTAAEAAANTAAAAGARIDAAAAEVPRPAFGGCLRAALHQHGLIAPLVALARELDPPPPVDSLLQGATALAATDLNEEAAASQAASTDQQQQFNTPAVPTPPPPLLHGYNQVVLSACHLLAMVDSPLDAGTVGLMMLHLGRQSNALQREHQGEADRHKLSMAAASTGAQVVSTLQALALHAEHRAQLVQEADCVSLLQQWMPAATARLERGQHQRRPQQQRHQPANAESSAAAEAPDGSIGVPRLDLGGLKHQQRSSASAGPAADRIDGTWRLALQTATFGLRAAWLLLREVALQRQADSGFPRGFDTLYKGSPTGWWGVPMRLQSSAAASNAHRHHSSGMSDPPSLTQQQHRQREAEQQQERSVLAALGLVLDVVGMGKPSSLAEEPTECVELRAVALRCCWNLAESDAAMRSQLLSLNIPQHLSSVCTAMAPTAAASATAVSDLQQAAAGCLVHLALTCDDAQGCSLQQAASHLVRLLQTAIDNVSTAATYHAPDAAASAASASAQAVANTDVPLLEAAVRGLARLSAEPEGGAEACVRAKAVQSLLQVLRIERITYRRLLHKQCQQQTQRSTATTSRSTKVSSSSGSAGSVMGRLLQPDQLERPLTAFQQQTYSGSGGQLPTTSTSTAKSRRSASGLHTNRHQSTAAPTVTHRSHPTGDSLISVAPNPLISDTVTPDGNQPLKDGQEGALALWALVNITAACPAGQLAACRHGLYTLIRIAVASPDRANRGALAATVLRNMVTHAGNTSAVYRAELRLKSAALLRAAGLKRPKQQRVAAGEWNGEGHAGCSFGVAQPPGQLSSQRSTQPPPSSRKSVVARSGTFEAAADAVLLTARWGLQGAGAARHVGADTAQAEMLLSRATPRLTVFAGGARITKEQRSAAAKAGVKPANEATSGPSSSGGGGPQSLVSEMAARISSISVAAAAAGSRGTPRTSALVPVPTAAAPVSHRSSSSHLGSAKLSLKAADQTSSASLLQVSGSSPGVADARAPSDIQSAFLRWCSQLEGADDGACNSSDEAVRPGGFSSTRQRRRNSHHVGAGGSSCRGAAAVSAGDGQPQLAGEQAGGEDLTTEDPEEEEWLELQRLAAEAEQYRAARAAQAVALNGKLNRSLCRGRGDLWQRKASTKQQNLHPQALASSGQECSGSSMTERGSSSGGPAAEGSGGGSRRQLLSASSHRSRAAGRLLGESPDTATAALDAAAAGVEPQWQQRCPATAVPTAAAAKRRPVSASVAANNPWEPNLVAFVQTPQSITPGPVRQRRAADVLMVAAAPSEVVDCLAGAV